MNHNYKFACSHNSKYTFLHSNGLTRKQLEKMDDDNFFDNKVVVIDEVHNLINGMATKNSVRANSLNDLFMKAHNLRLVFPNQNEHQLKKIL